MSTPEPTRLRAEWHSSLPSFYLSSPRGPDTAVTNLNPIHHHSNFLIRMWNQREVFNKDRNRQ